ncbi:MAG: Flp family type IVb pilin [Acidobacteriota bacterium]
MTKLIVALIFDSEGQDLIEYALLGGLIALGCFTAMAALASSLNAKFADIDASFVAAS